MLFKTSMLVKTPFKDRREEGARLRWILADFRKMRIATQKILV